MGVGDGGLWSFHHWERSAVRAVWECTGTDGLMNNWMCYGCGATVSDSFIYNICEQFGIDPPRGYVDVHVFWWKKCDLVGLLRAMTDPLGPRRRVEVSWR